jgi:hypothetical protein
MAATEVFLFPFPAVFTAQRTTHSPFVVALYSSVVAIFQVNIKLT